MFVFCAYYNIYSKVKAIINDTDVTGKTALHLALVEFKWLRAEKILNFNPSMWGLMWLYIVSYVAMWQS